MQFVMSFENAPSVMGSFSCTAENNRCIKVKSVGTFKNCRCYGYDDGKLVSDTITYQLVPHEDKYEKADFFCVLVD